MRILALDIGDRRIGVALSDPLRILATPLTTIERATPDTESAIDAILALAQQHEAAEILVGIPYLMSGRIGAQARITLDFAASSRRERTHHPRHSRRRTPLIRPGRPPPSPVRRLPHPIQRPHRLRRRRHHPPVLPRRQNLSNGSLDQRTEKLPQQTTVPSELRAQVWLSPLLMSVNLPSVGFSEI